MQKAGKKEMTSQLLDVRISKAAQVVWEGKARSVSSENTQGPFDILPMHANFISLIKDKSIVIVSESGEKLTHKLPTSVIYVANNTVKVFADILNISS